MTPGTHGVLGDQWTPPVLRSRPMPPQAGTQGRTSHPDPHTSTVAVELRGARSARAISGEVRFRGDEAAAWRPAEGIAVPLDPMRLRAGRIRRSSKTPSTARFVAADNEEAALFYGPGDNKTDFIS
jgi:hypothetical protein